MCFLLVILWVSQVPGAQGLMGRVLNWFSFAQVLVLQTFLRGKAALTVRLIQNFSFKQLTSKKKICLFDYQDKQMQEVGQVFEPSIASINEAIQLRNI